MHNKGHLSTKYEELEVWARQKTTCLTQEEWDSLPRTVKYEIMLDFLLTYVEPEEIYRREYLKRAI